MATLPDPECRYGYTVDQLRAILGDQFDKFARWMRGQTAALCEGREYVHGAKEYRATGCGPHGEAIYGHDVRQFLCGGRPLD